MTHFRKYFILILLGISIFLNILLLSDYDFKKTKSKELTYRFSYLARRIQTENPNDILINFLSLRKQLKEAVKEYGNSFAFYFEYLPTGISIGVNEKENFIGASLLQLPVVMAFYHQSEREGSDFTSKVVKIQTEDIDNSSGSLWTKGIGAEISLEEAARLTLIESDNTAVNILARNVLRQDFDEVYEGLDIEVKTDESERITYISPKGYSSILKALYFSALLRKETSEEILHLLSQSPVSYKLRDPIPGGIIISDKFGVYKNEGFQDCGIVYMPDRNYILCMMSKSDEKEARKRMVKVSEIVYKFLRDINSQ